MQFSDSILAGPEAQPGPIILFGSFVMGRFQSAIPRRRTYIYSPNVQLVLGVSVDVERNYPVIPVRRSSLETGPAMVLDAVLPTPAFAIYEMNVI